MDAIDLVHNEASALSGEGWLRSPVILLWDEVAGRLSFPDRHNVVLLSSHTSWMVSMA
jgi:Mlc titration factor MtfA (ptsG expression regulator)